ncbi:ATPase [Ketobacter alkanivorans]|uniref:ATPase n=2 Tax=Ketobacter alkanivorans TaxID=1917421 RepID=A0A2K9LRQ7_9GAMM|nr:ATPase [Ketobacter alkanivorans]
MNSLSSTQHGLTAEEAQQRLIQFGANQLPEAPTRPALLRFAAQFNNVLIYVLLASGGISLLMQHVIDATVIFGVVLINAIIGFVQEGKAEAALRAIHNMVRTECKVWRDHRVETLDSEMLVPGDVILLQSGDRVPADLRLFQVKDLRCDESALTGESQPVTKSNGELAEATPLAERSNMAYTGTLVTYGTALGLVVNTGVRTELGNIGTLVQQAEVPKTPLTRRLEQFARQLTYIIIALSGAMVLFGIFARQYDLFAMFQAAVGIAVAAVPEGLPAVVTITLAVGVQKMARLHALVRKLPSVEVLGSVSVICSDKTGTLTRNEMTATRLVLADCSLSVSGEGYGDVGNILDAAQNSLRADDEQRLSLIARTSLLCNTATVIRKDGQWQLSGDPTEGALVSLALKAGLTEERAAQEWPRNDMLPFESERRYMATLHHNHQGEHEILIKGGPDRLLPFCSHQLGCNGVEPLDADHWNQSIEELASVGLRVMALAYKPSPPVEELTYDMVEQDLILVAVVGITDPPRAEAIDAIRQCQQAGIRVKMITGDNPHTAAAIARVLGLRTNRVLTGADLDKTDLDTLPQQVQACDVFARTSPEHKLRIVEALQQQQHVVAMTGDGVNDAPALRAADIGIAMGRKGTDAAKDASDIVLTDDNFATIVAAVRQGRTVYDNILKAILFILPTSLAEASVISVAILLGLMLPITPAQILWINMITAITLALALSFEPSEPLSMNRPPRPIKQGLITGFVLRRLLFVGALGTLIVFGLFYLALEQGASIEKARTVAVNTLVFFEIFYLFNCRTQTPLWQNPRPFGGIAVWIAVVTVVALQMLFNYLPGFRDLFQAKSLSLQEWLWVLAGSGSVLMLVELEKWLTLYRQKRTETQTSRAGQN